jgi:hypothetical protein
VNQLDDDTQISYTSYTNGRYSLDTSAPNPRNALLLRQASHVSEVSAEMAPEWQPRVRITDNSLSGSNSSDEEEDAYAETESDTSGESSKVNETQSEMRKQIVLIQGDSSISAPEKAKRIQELMTRKWTQKQQQERTRDTRSINKLSDKKSDFNALSDEDKQACFQSRSVMGCRHYQRACKIQAHCCGKWDTCRFCHDEVSDHTITRSVC